ncbi:MAG: hypothetical protein ABGY75_16390 [Gemmataceae bacterium]
MKQQTYPVVCECGKTHPVGGGAAGSSLACGCGRTVEVPTLTALKASAGGEGLAPEMEIEGLLLARKLPLEPDCALCRRPTDDKFHCQVRCEAPTLKPPMTFWQLVLMVLFFPFLGAKLFFAAVLIDKADGTLTGRDVSFRLPVRMCRACMAELESWEVVTQAIRRTPVYAHLLDKYPNSRLPKTT